ncbi:ATP-binding protein [Methanohalophilus sp. RSK]|uniref:AAA family ATPase n=1 Tax=Methanohalophilus sp. RSK TaxID=2485783 RepID=UPI000F43B603|nr:ATP-binding protein [Methanohalophilus sp. RSK]RNI15745.1 ATP-binding protein [Methanohalophilus sp. RSK]
MADQIFMVGGEVEPPFFIGRDEIVEKIKLDITTSAQNNVIIGPRRIGKSSLLKNLKKSVQKEVVFTSVNCRQITDYADFFRLTTNALIKAHEEKSKIKGISQKFSYIFKGKISAATRSITEIGGSIEHIGNVYLRFREDEIGDQELMAETFEFIEQFADEVQYPIVIAFDEFQELSKFRDNIFNLLKSHMDKQPRVRYIFSGSSISLLHEVFLTPDSPLYLMAARIQLDPIKKDDVNKYIRSRLAIEDIEISDKALDKIYEYTDGFPFYFQKLGFILYQMAVLEKRNFIDDKQVDSAFSSMLNEFDSEFEFRYSSKFSRQQQDILKNLSKQKTRRISEIARDMDTPAYSLTTSMKDLYNTMTVRKTKKGTYGIVDNVFRIWIKKNILADVN